MNNQPRNKFFAAIGVIVLVVVFFFGFHNSKEPEAVGSIMDGQTYNVAVTAPALVGSSLIKPGPGTFGSVVLTGANTGTFIVYDASTTNALIRFPQATSSQRVLASFPAGTVVGTYVFDANFNLGLVVEFLGAVPTTTITYR